MAKDRQLQKLQKRPWFTYGEAREIGVAKREIYQLRDEGQVEELARGVFLWPDSGIADTTLLKASLLRPRSTLCLTSALSRGGLTDEIPRRHEIALPRGTRPPHIEDPIKWHSFDAGTFDIGRTAIKIDRWTVIGLYSQDRCVIDAFRMRGREGYETANEALRRWLALPRSNPSSLLAMARQFPRTVTPLLRALEILQ